MPASDQIVTAKLVLQAQLELQRLGNNKAMSLLESTEPDLAEYFIESTTTLYREILDIGASAKQARRIHDAMLHLVLVCLRSLQKGHAALWPEEPELAPKAEPPSGDGQ